MKENDKSQYVAMSLYFNKNSKEDMSIYRFLNVSRRGKSKFVVRVLLEYLKTHGITDVDSVSEKDLINIIEYNDLSQFSVQKSLPPQSSVTITPDSLMTALKNIFVSANLLVNNEETINSNKKETNSDLDSHFVNNEEEKKEGVEPKKTDKTKSLEMNFSDKKEEKEDEILSEYDEMDETDFVSDWEDGLHSFEI